MTNILNKKIRVYFKGSNEYIMMMIKHALELDYNNEWYDMDKLFDSIENVKSKHPYIIEINNYINNNDILDIIKGK